MAQSALTLSLASPQATAQAAVLLANALEAGDVILLSGPIGAGKSHFSRSLIQSILNEPEDVPSPTFTLVQTYETAKGELWHSDLYRLSNLTEIEELGLADAFGDAICLIEWPDRLGDLTPRGALTLELAQGPTENSRVLSAFWDDPKWIARTKSWRAL